MTKVTKKDMENAVLTECNFWFKYVEDSLKKGDVLEAKRYEYVISGARIVTRHLGHGKLADKIEEICNEASRLISIFEYKAGN